MEKKLETIIFEIDPETLAYRVDWQFAFVGDLYIVLTNLIERFESGELANEMELEDGQGKKFTATDLRKHIEDIRKDMRESESESACLPSAGGYKN